MSHLSGIMFSLQSGSGQAMLCRRKASQMSQSFGVPFDKSPSSSSINSISPPNRPFAEMCVVELRAYPKNGLRADIQFWA